MTDKDLIDFLNERLWVLRQTDAWPPKRLEFAGNGGALLGVTGSDIRAMTEEAMSMTAWIKPQPVRETPMLPHQQRVIDEKAELDERLGKLTAFFDTDPFPDLPQAEQDRMRRQATHMKRYSDILGERIEAWEQPGK